MLRRQNVGYSNFSQPQSHLSFCVLLQYLVERRRVVTQLGKLYFASRRQNTSWPRDWSSDVCSSDLSATRRPMQRGMGLLVAEGLPAKAELRLRSEERRVGKEPQSHFSSCVLIQYLVERRRVVTQLGKLD